MILQREILDGGIVVYVSPLLRMAGVPHAFATRQGGVSRGIFASMNLGNPSGCDVRDEDENIQENYRRLLAAIGCGARERCSVHQVHGNGVVEVRENILHERLTKADALVTSDPKRILSVRVADCVPVLLASEDGRRVAAIHSGWRGVIAGASAAALGAMDVSASRARAAIGPSIGFEAFEVGHEVLEAFERAMGSKAPIRRCENGKGFVDLREAIRMQLLDAGISAEHIDTTDRCTFRDRDEFYSHRREKGITGRMAAVIGVKG